jgi:hypothetical protein
MAIELAALLAGVQTISGIVDGSLKIVDSIGQRFSRANADAKQRLQGQISDLRHNLANAGTLALAASAYLEALEQIRHLSVDVLLLQEYLDHNQDGLRNHMSPIYDRAWQAVSQFVGAIDRDRDLPTQVRLNRRQWFDKADDEMIGSRLNDVNDGYTALEERVKNRHFDDVRTGLDRLQKPLRETDVLLHNTIADTILPSLANLRALDTDAASSGQAGK